MALTAQQLLDTFNARGIDTATKLTNFLILDQAIQAAFLGSGFASQEQATAALSGLKLQNDLNSARAALSAEQARWQTVSAEHAAEVSAAVVQRDAAQTTWKAFVLANSSVSGASADAYAQAKRDLDAAEIALEAIGAEYAAEEAAHNQTVSDLAAAVDAAQAALDAHATG
jgi:hypothetical protein